MGGGAGGVVSYRCYFFITLLTGCVASGQREGVSVSTGGEYTEDVMVALLLLMTVVVVVLVVTAAVIVGKRGQRKGPFTTERLQAVLV